MERALFIFPPVSLGGSGVVFRVLFSCSARVTNRSSLEARMAKKHLKKGKKLAATKTLTIKLTSA